MFPRGGIACLLVVGLLLPSVPLCNCTSMHLPSSIQVKGISHILLQRNLLCPKTYPFFRLQNFWLLVCKTRDMLYLSSLHLTAIGALLDPSSPSMHKRAKCEPFLQHLYFTPFFVTFFHIHFNKATINK